ncbi:MAG: response regulator [Phycisphaerae bacterium]
MTFHALVVDDSTEVLDDVKDRLESLGHTCDCVTCLQDARDCLGENRYSYVLLDLEIPVRYGRRSRIANGQNLLREIRGMEGYENLPIIVMTSHGHDSPDLAVEVLRGNGAIDYVKKPFPDKGHTLAKAVQDALAAAGRSRAGAARRLGPKRKQDPLPFEEGDMVFFEDRVELCGVKICGDNSSMNRRILDELKQQNRHGRPVAYSGVKLADKVECESGANGVSGAVRELRQSICHRLLEEANIQCGPRDVIQSGGRGYRLTDKITVRDAHDPQNDPQSDTQTDPQNEPNDPQSGEASDGDVAGLNERQRWIWAQLKAGVKLRNGDVAAEFGRSPSTIKRDLQGLKRTKGIEFVGAARTGYWRLGNGESG